MNTSSAQRATVSATAPKLAEEFLVKFHPDSTIIIAKKDFNSYDDPRHLVSQIKDEGNDLDLAVENAILDHQSLPHVNQDAWFCIITPRQLEMRGDVSPEAFYAKAQRQGLGLVYITEIGIVYHRFDKPLKGFIRFAMKPCLEFGCRIGLAPCKEGHRSLKLYNEQGKGKDHCDLDKPVIFKYVPELRHPIYA